MYDELVKMLRTCEERDSCIGCGVACPYINTGLCDNKAGKAADAIEALSEKEKTAQWIPVTERLPDDRRDVQITVFWHDAWRTMYGYYDGAFWHLYAPMHTEVADVEVIGWMEKPAPMLLPKPVKKERA